MNLINHNSLPSKAVLQGSIASPQTSRQARSYNSAGVGGNEARAPYNGAKGAPKHFIITQKVGKILGKSAQPIPDS